MVLRTPLSSRSRAWRPLSPVAGRAVVWLLGGALVGTLVAGCGQPAPSNPAGAAPSATSSSSSATPSPSATARGSAPTTGVTTPGGGATSATAAAVTATPTAPKPNPSATARPIDAAATALIRLQLQCPTSMGIHVLATQAVPALAGTEVVAAECAAGAGSPPSGVYTLTGSGSVVHLGQTLVPPTSQVLVHTLTASSAGVQLGGYTFSSPTVPRCCPDRPVSMAWTVRGKDLVPQTD